MKVRIQNYLNIPETGSNHALEQYSKPRTAPATNRVVKRPHLSGGLVNNPDQFVGEYLNHFSRDV
jgi:hypothetical protein